jgi:hypothetical protein
MLTEQNQLRLESWISSSDGRALAWRKPLTEDEFIADFVTFLFI